jgi:isopentenyl diphosphate isomerase/L-lactate dehydrogenase-like FMN-dependent dehydrogenase
MPKLKLESETPAASPESGRRVFMQRAAVMGAGLLAAPAIASAKGLEAMTGMPALLAEGEPPATPAAAPVTAAPKPKGLTLDKVLEVAREKLYPRCRVCPECDGVACAGEVPGMGGLGSGMSFKNNYTSLQRVQLKMRTFHDVKKPDLTTTVFGYPLGMPITSAVTGGTTYNMGGVMGEEEYVNAILGGCLQAGTLGFVADGIGDNLEVFQRRLKVLADNFKGKAIVMIKPKTQEEIIKRVKMVEASGGIAWGIDIDSAGRAARAVPGQTVEPKTPAQLRELAKCSKLPFIIKGIMTLEEAQIAVDMGAAGICISNHGGRVLDHTPGVAEVLPQIAAKLKGKVVIFADGAVRYGTDALKLLALGADVVMVGRPLVRGAHGAGKEGVALMLNKMKTELTDACVLTGSRNIRSINRSILA